MPDELEDPGDQVDDGNPSEEGSFFHPCEDIDPARQHESRKDNHGNLLLREKYREEDIDGGIVSNEGYETEEVDPKSVTLEVVGDGNVAESAEESCRDDGDTDDVDPLVAG